VYASSFEDVTSKEEQRIRNYCHHCASELRQRFPVVILEAGPCEASKFVKTFVGTLIAACILAPGLYGQVSDASPADKPYTLTLTIAPTGGYDSNPLQLGDGLSLPSGVSHKGYGFFLIDGTLDFDWKSADQNNEFEATYEYTQQFFEGLSGNDEGDHVWDLVYIHVFDQTWSALAEFYDKYVTIDGHSFANKAFIRPEVDCQTSEFLVTQLAASGGRYSNFFPVDLQARDPDADFYSVEVFEKIILKNLKSFSLKLGYLHFWNDGKGSDYEYGRNRLQARLETRLSEEPSNPLHNLDVIAKYVHDFDGYENLNSHAGPSGFAFKRSDDKDLVDVLLTYDLIADRHHVKNLALTLEYSFVRNNSNIPLFNYPDHTVMAGLQVKFQ